MPSPVILITGFGPFPGVPDNPSAMIARTLAREGYEAHVLPTEYAAGLSQFRDLLTRIDPDIIVCFGVAGKSKAVRLERIANNAMRGDKPDASGVRHAGAIDEGGPATYASSLPLDEIKLRLKQADIPVRISNSAGRYLCNFLFYNLMREIARGQKPQQGGFIHIPKPDAPGFSNEKLIEAARAVIAACTEAAAPQAAPKSS